MRETGQWSNPLEYMQEQFGDDADNIVMMAEKLLRVRTRKGIEPLRANPVQRMFESHYGRDNVVLKGRQMGMTTWVMARFFLQAMQRPGKLSLHVAHTQEAAEAMFSTVRRMWLGLPDDLRKGPARLARANVRQMVFAEIDSEIRVASAADENAGRGLSVHSLHCSEVARWKGDAAATLAGLQATLAPHGDCVLESTPNGVAGAFHDAWETAGDRGAVQHFFPWWMEDAYRGRDVPLADMSEDERALVTQHGLTGEQIGFRRHLERTYGVLRTQEFAEDATSCFRASGSCCFELDAIDRRLKELPEPLHQRRNGALWIWLPPRTGRRYLVSVDPAGGGVAGDFSAAQVVDVMTGMQCAELQARMRPADLARIVAGLAREYRDACVLVERNNHGAAVLSYLDNGEEYENVWRDERGEAGYMTSNSSKSKMIAALEQSMREVPTRIMSRRLLAECRTFVMNDNGTMAATPGSHDDLVMAMAMAERVRPRLMVRR